MKERAKAEAEANILRAKSITPELLKMEQLKIERERIKKWNGSEPHTVIQSPNVQVGGK